MAGSRRSNIFDRIITRLMKGNVAKQCRVATCGDRLKGPPADFNKNHSKLYLNHKTNFAKMSGFMAIKPDILLTLQLKNSFIHDDFLYLPFRLRVISLLRYMSRLIWRIYLRFVSHVTVFLSAKLARIFETYKYGLSLLLYLQR